MINKNADLVTKVNCAASLWLSVVRGVLPPIVCILLFYTAQKLYDNSCVHVVISDVLCCGGSGVMFSYDITLVPCYGR